MSLLRSHRFLFATLMLIMSVSVFVMSGFSYTRAAANPQVNYQGKLTDSTNMAVPDGTYNMRFWLLTSPTIATTSAIWTEELTGSNRVTVTNGLFSVMLGSTSPLTSVDFNQTLYLGVEIGSTTGSALWDGEMSPRKILGTVPAAFVADTLDGVNSTQFVRTDATSSISASTADTLLSVTQNGAGDILNLFDGGTEVFSVVDGGNIGVGTTSPSRKFTVQGGDSYFGGNLTGTGTLTISGLTTLADVTAVNATTSAATTTYLFASLFNATNALITNATSTTFRTGTLGVGSDYITDITGSGLSIVNGALTASGDGASNWLYNGSRLSPSTTVGIGVFASSTIGDGTGAGGLTVAGNSTTTGSLIVLGTATSTFSAGIQLTGGCFRDASATSTCIGKGQAATYVVAASNSKNKQYADYQATGTNDQVVINAAINAAFDASRGTSGVGGKVYLLEGDYSVNGDITLATSTHLIGSGNGTVIRLANGVNTTVNIISATNVSYVTISDLLIDGNQANNTGTQRGVTLTSVSSSTVKNVTATGTRQYGIYLVSTSNSTVLNNVVNGGLSNGIFLSSSLKNAVIGNTVSNNTSSGITLTSSHYSLVSDNVVTANGANGITVAGLNIAVTGNNVSGNTTSGIAMSGPSWTTVSGNLITENKQHGVTFSATPTHNTITGNTFSNNGSSGVYYAINLASGNDNVISSNSIYGTSTDPLVVISSGATRNSVVGNILSNPDTSSYISDAGTDTRYTEWDRLTLDTKTMGEVTNSLFSISGSSSVALASSTQWGSGKLFSWNTATSGEVMTLANSGFLGLGSSTPSRKLTIGGGDIWVGGNIIATGTASSTYASTSALTLFQRLYDTNQSAGSSGQVLTSTGTSTIWTTLATGGSSNWLYNGSRLSPSTTVGIGVFASSTIGGGTGATGLTISGGATTTGNAYFGGNVGIGTVTPSQTLTVSGTGLFSSGGYNMTISPSTGSQIFIQDGGGNSITSVGFSGSNTSVIAQYDGGILRNSFSANGVSYLTGGSVGVGTTSPTAKLTIADTDGGTSPLFTVSSSTNGTATSTLLTVLAGGNVGIGTNSPVRPLHVVYAGGAPRESALFASDCDACDVGINISNTAIADGGESASIHFTIGGEDAPYGYMGAASEGSANGTLFFAPSLSGTPTTRMIINSQGRVGIGTTSPSSRLTVWGDGSSSTTALTRFVNSASTTLLAIFEDGRTAMLTASSTYASTTNLTLYGMLRDTNSSTGTRGMVLLSTGTSTLWTATSSLGLSSTGDGVSNWLYNGSRLSPSTTVGIGVFASSTIGGGTGATGLTVAGNSTTTLNAYIGGTLGIATTSPSALLSVAGSGTGNLFAFASSTGSNLLALDARGRLIFGSTTVADNDYGADIFINGGSTTTNPQTNRGNVALGNSAFSFYSPGQAGNNIAIGQEALYGSSTALMTGSLNNALGYQALWSNTSGNENNAFGPYALRANTSGSYNNAFGGEALISNTSGSDNNAFGIYALHENTTGNGNNAMGSSSMVWNTTGSHNNAFGYQTFGGAALAGTVTGSYNNVMGYQAMAGTALTTISGSHNNALGYQALMGMGGMTGSDNNAIGQLALWFNQTGSFNTAIGYAALAQNTTGNGNNAIGYAALQQNDTGATSTAIGSLAGFTNTSGNHNLFLGDEADTIHGTHSNLTAIGSHAKASSSNSMVLGGTGLWNVNIITGSSTPYAKFSIQNNYGSTTALFDIATTTSASYATSSLFRVGHDGRVGIGSSTPSRLLTVSGDAIFANIWATGTASSTYASTSRLSLYGQFYDANSSAGSSGQVLTSTGTSTIWTTLSASGGGSNWLYNGSRLSPSTTVGIGVFASSTIGGGTGATGLSILGNATTTGSLIVQGSATSTFAGGIQLTGGCFRDASATSTCIGKGQSATYVVAASNSKNKQYADYIADGTGDQNEINHAIQAAYTTSRGLGGKVYLLEGDYSISDSINLAYVGTQLVGSGNGTVITLAASAASSQEMVNISASSTIISDLTLDGNASNQTNDNYGILIDSPGATLHYDTLITRNIIRNVNGEGIIASGYPIDVTIANNSILLNDTGIREFGYFWTIEGNQVRGNTVVGMTFGGGGNHTITGNTIVENGAGVTDYAATERVTFTGNLLSYNTGSPITLNDLNTRYWTITSNVMHNNSSGMAFSESAGIIVSDNTSGAGITVTTVTDSTFSQNRLDGAIALSSGANNNSIIGNMLGGSPMISIDASSNNNTVSSNNPLVGTSYAISDSATTTRYTQRDRLSLDSRGLAQSAYSLFSISGSSSVALASSTQWGSGKLFSWNTATSGEVMTLANSGFLGLGSSTPSRKLTVSGDAIFANTWATGTASSTYASTSRLTLHGQLYDTNGTAGSSGQVLTSTGTSTIWTTFTASGDGVSNWLYNGSRLSPSTTVGIGIFASSTLSELNFTNATGTNATTTNLSATLARFTTASSTYASSTGLSAQRGYLAQTLAVGTTSNWMAIDAWGPTFSTSYPFNAVLVDSSAMAQDVGGGIAFGGSDGDSLERWYGGIRGGKENGTSANYDGYLSLYTRQNGVSSNTERLRITSTGNVGIGTTIAPARLTVLGSGTSGSTRLASFFNSVGTELLSLYENGNIVVGTSTPYAKFSIQNAYGSTTALFDIATTTSSAFATSSLFRVGHDGKVSLGSTTPEGRLTIQNTAATGSVIAGIKEYFNFANSTASAIYYGDNAYIVNAPNATSTLVGKIIRIEDSTSLGNTVRGLEVQAQRGTNTKGENTALSGFGRTFGIRGTTEGDAGDTFVPAGVFAESRGTTQGNALRAYSGTITTSSLMQLFHDTSVFSGTGLLMNFGNSGGSFAPTSSAKFIDLKIGGTSKFTVTAGGTTTIGDGTTANMAGLQIGFGGICVDNDGSCTATTSGKITAVSYGTANSDLAEMYFSDDDLMTGEIVSLAGGLSIDRAVEGGDIPILGVVSTKPGLVMGSDDSSLASGETGYPIGLKGRVPVRLSTENGPILKGDRIALSSIPGVGMKALESDMTVGIALEDWDGEGAYSDGFVNQFADDLVKAKMKPRSVDTDVRTQDGCSYGAGGAQGEEGCVKEKVAPIKVETITVDERTEVIAELRAEDAEVMEIEGGEEVSVGQAIMFIDLDYHFAQKETDFLKEILSTTTVSEGNGEETLWDRIKTLAQNFVDGVLRVAGIKTDELCVGDVCVDEAQFLKLIESANQNAGPRVNTDDDTVVEDDISEEETSVDQGEDDSESSDGGEIIDGGDEEGEEDAGEVENNSENSGEDEEDITDEVVDIEGDVESEENVEAVVSSEDGDEQGVSNEENPSLITEDGSGGGSEAGEGNVTP